MPRPTTLLDLRTPCVDSSPNFSRFSLQTPSGAHKFSVSQQAERTAEDSRWNEAVDEDVSCSQARYVHNQFLESSYGLSIPGEPILPWQGYSTVTGMQSVSPDRRQYGILDLAGAPLHDPSIPIDSPTDFSYQKGAFPPYLQQPWHDPQEYRTEDMEPT